MNRTEYTAEQFAADYRLFAEYIDPMGATSEDEFNAMSFDERVALCQQTMDSNQ
jgi:hypothetical protein